MSNIFTGVKRFIVLTTVVAVNPLLAQSLPSEEGLRARSLSILDQKMVNESQHATQFLYHNKKTPICALVMHGLHESPAFMNSLAHYYSNRGMNVISLRLPGHQMQDPQAINKVKAEEWVTAAEAGFEACKEVSEKVEVVGYSTGGTLAVYLALNHPQEVSRTVLLSPALALSNRVFLSSLLLGFTGIDSTSFCKSAEDNSRLCRLLKRMDPQIDPMIKEGLVSSPAAGFQVQQLIGILLAKFLPQSFEQREGAGNYYASLMALYNQLKTPLVMINTRNDNVVYWKFNQKFFVQYAGNKKNSVLFEEGEKISHIHINKAGEDCFKSSPQICNPKFEQVIQALDVDLEN